MRLTKNDKELVKAVLESMAEDLEEVVERYGLGACVVRVIDSGNRIVLTGRAHEMQNHGVSEPTEVVGFRDVRRRKESR